MHRLKFILRTASRPTYQLLLAGAMIAVAGCAIDQKKEVATYRKVLDSKIAPPSAEPPGPLTLAHALSAANQNNEELAERGEDYLQSIINKDRAVANFLPTVSFQPSYTVEQRYRPSAASATTITAPGGGVTTVTPAPASVTTVSTGFRKLGPDALQSAQAPIIGGMNLFRGFGDLANLKVAEANTEQRKQLLLDAQAGILVDVAQVFYQVLRSEQQLTVLQNSLKVQNARVEDERHKLQNGLSTRLAVAQVEAQRDATRAEIAQTQGDVLNARTMLAYLTGESTDDIVLLDDLAVPTQRPAMQQWEDEGAINRQDLLAAIAAKRAARAAVDAAIAEYYPSVSLNVEGFLYREFYSDASKWNAILSANVPIFSAGVIRTDVRTAWSRLRQAALNESDVRRIVLRDVQQAYENLATAEQRINELQGEVAAANDALQQAQAALNNQLGIVLDVLTAQDQLLNAQLQLTSAKFDRSVFYLSLLRSVGRLPDTTGVPSQTTAPATNASPTSAPMTQAVR